MSACVGNSLLGLRGEPVQVKGLSKPCPIIKRALFLPDRGLAEREMEIPVGV